MRIPALAVAALLATIAGFSAPRSIVAMGKPGITQVPCSDRQWQFSDAAFEALPGARAYFGKYDGGLYRIEIPDSWNGELVLYAHGYAAETGTNGTMLRVGNHSILEHLIKEGFAWAA